MTRYYFHVRNGFGYAQDEEGVDLDSLSAVKAMALEGARSLLSSEIREGRLDLRGRIEVTDAGNREVMTIPFADVLEIITGSLPAGTEQDEVHS